jgi:hypothetical protein
MAVIVTGNDECEAPYRTLSCSPFCEAKTIGASVFKIDIYARHKDSVSSLLLNCANAMSVSQIATLAHSRAHSGSNETAIRVCAGYLPVANTRTGIWEAWRATNFIQWLGDWTSAQRSSMHQTLTQSCRREDPDR